MKKYFIVPIELLSFFFAIGLLLGMVIIPGISQVASGQGGILFSYQYVDHAFEYALALFFLYMLFFGFIWLKFGRRWVSDRLGISVLIAVVPKLKYAFYMLLLAVPLWILSIDFAELINPTARFHSQYPILQSLAQWLILVAMTVVLLNTGSRPSAWVFVFILLVFYQLYPVSISSRSAAFPFIVLLVYFLIYRRSFIMTGIFALFIVSALAAALQTRHDLGYYNFINNFVYYLNVVHAYDVIAEIFPGIGSISLAMEMFSGIDGFGVGRFLVYISPAPSFIIPILPGSTVHDLGFTNYLGATNIGLNTDILSEWIFWVGDISGSSFLLAAFFGAIFFTAITATPLFLIRFRYLEKLSFRIIFQICIIFFFAAGMSMPIRGSSRLVVYAIVMVLCYPIVRKFKLSYRS